MVGTIIICWREEPDGMETTNGSKDYSLVLYNRPLCLFVWRARITSLPVRYLLPESVVPLNSTQLAQW